jgi:hypothetical protein
VRKLGVSGKLFSRQPSHYPAQIGCAAGGKQANNCRQDDEQLVQSAHGRLSGSGNRSSGRRSSRPLCGDGRGNSLSRYAWRSNWRRLCGTWNGCRTRAAGRKRGHFYRRCRSGFGRQSDPHCFLLGLHLAGLFLKRCRTGRQTWNTGHTGRGCAWWIGNVFSHKFIWVEGYDCPAFLSNAYSNETSRSKNSPTWPESQSCLTDVRDARHDNHRAHRQSSAAVVPRVDARCSQ